MVDEIKPNSVPTSTKRLPIRIVVLGVVLVVCLVLAVFVAGSAYASTSNKNVPVFSSVVEVVENLALTDSQTAEIVQEDMKDSIFSVILDMRKSQSESSPVQFESSEEDISKFINEKQEMNSARFEGVLTVVSSSTVSAGFNGFFSPDGVDVDYKGSLDESEPGAEFDGEFKIVEGKGYAKVDRFPTELLGLSSLDQLKGQWVEFGSEDASNPMLTGMLGTGATVPGAGSTAISFSQRDLEDIATFIDSEEFANRIERTDDEVIKGVRTNCFKMDLDQDDLTKLSMKYFEITGMNTDEQALSDSMKGQHLVIAACSGRKDGNMYRLSIELTSPDAETGSVTMKVEVKLWDHNKVSDKIEKPSDTVPFSTLFAGFASMLSELEGTTGTGTDLPANDLPANLLPSPDPANIKWDNYDLDKLK